MKSLKSKLADGVSRNVSPITHLMVYIGYPVNKKNKKEPNGVARQRYLSNISVAA